MVEAPPEREVSEREGETREGMVEAASPKVEKRGE